MRQGKAQIIALITGFMIGLTLVFIYSLIASLFGSTHQRPKNVEQSNQPRCSSGEYFATPEDVLSSLKSEEVSARRDAFRRLFLRPGITTVYYDYERDRNYPERADRVRLQYLNLDESSEAEALITFVRLENPVALILKRETCGWRLIAALSSWLRFEDYPYEDWLELPETIRPGTHEILIRDSTGDAAQYTRKARLLKLIDGSLEQVAEFEEEAIRPLAEYHEPDWSNVKHHQMTRYTFLPETQDKAARLQLEVFDEVVKYSGAAPIYTYWLETDGAWHASRKHWRSRPAERSKLLHTRKQEFVWDEQRRKFVKDSQESRVWSRGSADARAVFRVPTSVGFFAHSNSPTEVGTLNACVSILSASI